MKKALVLGSGGFIGSHMVTRLKSEGYWVRGVDLKNPEFSPTTADEFIIEDLRNPLRFDSILRLTEDLEYSFFPAPFEKRIQFDEIYQFAADMGGAGFVFTGENDADIMHNSATINLNLLDCLSKTEFKGRVFYSSSACMYPQGLQKDSQNSGLREDDAYPADPDSEYGWEKLFSERLYFAYARNKGIDVRVARFHNIYGPEGTYKGGREKAPAAMCRKVIESDGFTIDVWGTGHQTRSFLYIDDCIDAVRMLMQSDFVGPVNIGSEAMVTINDLAYIAIDLSDNKGMFLTHSSGPVGVMGRNSNNDLIRKELNWRPKFTLLQGMELTYQWIKQQYESA